MAIVIAGGMETLWRSRGSAREPYARRPYGTRYYQIQTTDGQQQPVKSLAQSVAACVTKNPPCAACSSCRRAGSVSCVFTGRVMSSIACAFSDGTLRTAEMIPFRIRFSSLMRRAFSMRLASSSARSRLTWIVRRISSSSFSRQNSVFSAYLNSCSMMLSLLLPPSRGIREHAVRLAPRDQQAHADLVISEGPCTLPAAFAFGGAASRPRVGSSHQCGRQVASLKHASKGLAAGQGMRVHT